MMNHGHALGRDEVIQDCDFFSDVLCAIASFLFGQPLLLKFDLSRQPNALGNAVLAGQLESLPVTFDQRLNLHDTPG